MEAEQEKKNSGGVKTIADVMKEIEEGAAAEHAVKQRGDEWPQVHKLLQGVCKDEAQRRAAFPDLTSEPNFRAHWWLMTEVATRICLGPQQRKFVVDDDNRQLLRFMLHYFNNSPRALEVWPERRYKLEKPLLLIGKPGTGKTLLMQVMSEYLRRTGSPNAFFNVSSTQMVNYYSLHNSLDKFTYNEEGAQGKFEGDPYNLCLNDLGVVNRKFYGVDTKTLTEDFLHARNEIWVNTGRRAHLTTNLTRKELAKEYADNVGGRLVDRFKAYNIIEMTGESRR